MSLAYPPSPFGKQSRWIHNRDFSRNPSGELNVQATTTTIPSIAIASLWTATNITTAGWSSAPTFAVGKSGMLITGDGTDNAGFELQSNQVLNLVNIGDKIVVRREFALGTVAESGLFFGLAETDTSVYNNTIGSQPNNCIGVHKTITGTELTFVMRSASGTAYTKALALPAAITTATRYWIEIEVTKTAESATSGQVIVRIGTNVYPDSDPISQGTGRQWVISDQAIPISTANLRETFACLFSTATPTITMFGGSCFAYSARGLNL